VPDSAVAGVRLLSSLPATPTVDQVRRWWWLHDSYWYHEIAERIGFERANEINRRVLRSVGRRVGREVLKESRRRLADMPWPEVVDLFASCPRLMWPAPMLRATYRVTGPGSFEASVLRNFALMMLLRVGAVEQYDCPCLDVREGWFEGLGLCVVENVCTQCLRRGGSACTFVARVAGYDPRDTLR